MSLLRVAVFLTRSLKFLCEQVTGHRSVLCYAYSYPAPTDARPLGLAVSRHSYINNQPMI